MTQDCSITLSIADENSSVTSCFPKGIHVTEAELSSGSGIGNVSYCDSPSMASAPLSEAPWGYVHIHNKQVELFKRQVDAYNAAHPEARHECFVHYSYKYKPKNNGKGVVKKLLPTINGLVFLQGHTAELQQFLSTYHPQTHLIKNCSTGHPAVISHRMMQPFMQAITGHPDNVTFLRDPFVKFAKDHVKLRVLTGLFKGLEGYIVRIDRDRQLVMEFAGYAVAIRGVHNEDFEVVEG